MAQTMILTTKGTSPQLVLLNGFEEALTEARFDMPSNRLSSVATLALGSCCSSAIPFVSSLAATCHARRKLAETFEKIVGRVGLAICHQPADGQNMHI
jgi:hypothetical protein